MPNRHRGEVEAVLDGAPYKLCLTLGALAELESAFGDDDMLALAERFQTGRLSARDATRIIGAGLRGAGHGIDDDAVMRMRADNGAAGMVGLIARLLAATFGGPAGGVVADLVAGAITQPLRASADAMPSTFGSPPLPFPGPK
jgi:Phage tail tube protein, GTA-gp10